MASCYDKKEFLSATFVSFPSVMLLDRDFEIFMKTISTLIFCMRPRFLDKKRDEMKSGGNILFLARSEQKSLS